MNTLEVGAEAAKNVLEHYGVKGMRWGVRRKRDSSGPEPVKVQARPGKRVKAKGGKESPVAEDAIEAARLRQIAKRSTTDSLSNKELQALIGRMNLEEQYDRLAKSEVRLGRGHRMAKGILKNLDPDTAVGLVAAGATRGAGKKLAPGTLSAVRMGANVVRTAAGGKPVAAKKDKKKNKKDTQDDE